MAQKKKKEVGPGPDDAFEFYKTKDGRSLSPTEAWAEFYSRHVSEDSEGKTPQPLLAREDRRKEHTANVLKSLDEIVGEEKRDLRHLPSLNARRKKSKDFVDKLLSFLHVDHYNGEEGEELSDETKNAYAIEHTGLDYENLINEMLKVNDLRSPEELQDDHPYKRLLNAIATARDEDASEVEGLRRYIANTRSKHREIMNKAGDDIGTEFKEGATIETLFNKFYQEHIPDVRMDYARRHETIETKPKGKVAKHDFDKKKTDYKMPDAA